MTEDEVRALPVMVDLLTAGKVLGMGRTATYHAVRDGIFPVEVIRMGKGEKSPMFVRKVDLLRMVGL